MSISLYDVFHEHLINPGDPADIPADLFAEKVVSDYLNRVIRAGHIVPESAKSEIAFELRDEVLLMTRKKTYGHFSVSAYRKSKLIK